MEVKLIDLKIKPMALQHLPQVRQIEQASFSSAWSITAFLKELANESAYYYVGFQGQEIVGYVGSWVLKNELHITNLAVAPDYRRQGAATQFLQFMYAKASEENLNKVSLEVRVSNKSAQRLYIKEGFIKVNRKPNYYKDNGEDAVVMWKQL